MTGRTDPWRTHRLLKRMGIVSVVFLFLMFGLVTIGQFDMRSQAFRVLTFGWIVFGLGMLTVTHEVRCPRCGQRFYAKGAEFWQMTRTCLHCGQEKYAQVSSGPIPGSDGQ